MNNVINEKIVSDKYKDEYINYIKKIFNIILKSSKADNDDIEEILNSKDEREIISFHDDFIGNNILDASYWFRDHFFAVERDTLYLQKLNDYKDKMSKIDNIEILSIEQPDSESCYFKLNTSDYHKDNKELCKNLTKNFGFNQNDYLDNDNDEFICFNNKGCNKFNIKIIEDDDLKDYKNTNDCDAVIVANNLACMSVFISSEEIEYDTNSFRSQMWEELNNMYKEKR
ncbi:hypothetical protein DY052_06395 [Apilactobacillus timberlakei]|uniref:hypothetical protein n=1 Tax=Apilactobacillus timberlakei TaxID=2008380 RepID=UPI00112EC36A|nr:hypothetical protein [Apilactobacillus timberlakei]TPR15054.1 hypothetical protein DY052_06395 [Apilactobacillus timberlakei]